MENSIICLRVKKYLNNSIFNSPYISFENKKFGSKLLGIIAPLFPNMEEFIITTLYVISPAIDDEKLKKYPYLKQIPPIFDELVKPCHEGLLVTAFPQFIKVRYTLEKIFNKMKADISFSLKKKLFKSYFSNYYGWPNIPSSTDFKVPYPKNLIAL